MRHRPVLSLPFVPRTVCAAALAALCTSAGAQTAFSAEVFQNYGGNYSAACQDPAAARLRVKPDALVFAIGGKAITGREVQSAYSYLGNTPPKGFMVALMSQVKGNTSMVFLIYQGKQGPYIELEADDKLASALGKARMAAKYQRCNDTAP